MISLEPCTNGNGIDRLLLCRDVGFASLSVLSSEKALPFLLGLGFRCMLQWDCPLSPVLETGGRLFYIVALQVVLQSPLCNSLGGNTSSFEIASITVEGMCVDRWR